MDPLSEYRAWWQATRRRCAVVYWLAVGVVTLVALAVGK